MSARREGGSIPGGIEPPSQRGDRPVSTRPEGVPPDAYFVASQFKFDGPKVTELRGEFTLRGVSNLLSLHATSFACRTDAMLQREVCGGDFEAELKRSDYGSTFGPPFVGDEVRLLISVEGIRD